MYNLYYVDSKNSLASPILRLNALIVASLLVTVLAGCSHRRSSIARFGETGCGVPCQSMLQQLEYTDIQDDFCSDDQVILSSTPMTISNFQDQVPWDMTLEECVELALANSKVLQKFGGVVVKSPVATRTLFDQAITETNGSSVEAALAAFDAQVSSSLYFDHTERKFNNPLFGGGANSQISNLANFNFEISKQTAAGTSFAVRNLTDYNRNNNQLATAGNPFGNRFASVYNTVNQVEVRQPLLRGRGTAVNRIAGPNAVAGQYNGVLIARIRSDISLTDFEMAVRDLVRDVESNYWELYFSYQDLDTKISARESARETWENRKLRYVEGVDRLDEEAQPRQQYFIYQSQAQNALTGVPNGQLGVLGAERNLRRLMGQLASDGRIIKPVSEPVIAPVQFDWDSTQSQALERRSEIRRQKWTVRQRELELVAAKALNQWRFDVVGQYGFRGFGDDLFGNNSVPEGSAFADLIDGDLDDWQLGFELGGAIGNRTGHLAVRNAELNLVRERTLLKEQQRQIIHDLNAAYTEVDRAQATLKTSFNSRIAVKEELEAKRKRVAGGLEDVFFQLDGEQRAAQAESAVHRAVVDYNQALLNYAYVSGSMLSRYNVSLTEGPWSAGAQQNANAKAGRFSPGGPATRSDVGPVTSGTYPQTAMLPTSSEMVSSDTYEVGVMSAGNGGSNLDTGSGDQPESDSRFPRPEPETDSDIDLKSDSDELNKLLPSSKTSSQPNRVKPASTVRSYFSLRR